AGLAATAIEEVAAGRLPRAYALSRPPGHHCLPDRPMGFCLLANIAIGLERARAQGLAKRVAVVDWDVHHGNGTEAIYRDDGDTLTISIHQEGNYPWGSGAFAADTPGVLNLPLPPGAGHETYIDAMDRVVIPALHRFGPELIVVACGYDASAVDPLARMLAGADTFACMTEQVMGAADALCDGRLVLVHEGGYSEVHVPFCGHAVLQTLAGSNIAAPDPLAGRIAAHQPNARMRAVFREIVDGYRRDLGL
ncbi:MAG: class II histone deacetylase, partial [Pseudomonadota bacterium]